VLRVVGRDRQRKSAPRSHLPGAEGARPDRGMPKTPFGRGYRLVRGWTIRQESRTASPVASRNTADGCPSISGQFPGARYRPDRSLGGRPTTAGPSVGYRVVTLTGPGGIEKSALALKIARSLFPSFDGDGCLVDLVPLFALEPFGDPKPRIRAGWATRSGSSVRTRVFRP
jgi:hypothetical protein